MFQNMLFLENVVEDVHKLTRDLYKVSKGEEEPTKKDMEDWLEMAKKVSDVINQQIFVIMTAQAEGWGFGILQTRCVTMPVWLSISV